MKKKRNRGGQKKKQKGCYGLIRKRTSCAKCFGIEARGVGYEKAHVDEKPVEKGKFAGGGASRTMLKKKEGGNAFGVKKNRKEEIFL